MEKKKEAEIFKTDLISETERVREARFQFDLDSERFESFKREQKTQRTMVTDQLRKAREKREELDSQIQ
jgi:hypothetical protein